MPKRMSTKEFIERAVKVHGDFYDYSFSSYSGSRHKVLIVCQKHGSFYQNAGSHLEGHGCRKCSNENASNRSKYGLKYFINKSILVHGGKYDYSLVEYKNSRSDVLIICKEHGVFKQNARGHTKGNGCPMCGVEKNTIKKTKSQDEFIKEAIGTHGDRYDYSKVKYVRSGDKVIIICPRHGEFMQKPHAHIAGNGCAECMYEYCLFRKDDWIRKAGSRNGIFYIIKCHDDNECFYKFGITCRSVKKRYEYKAIMPYNYEIVRMIVSRNLSYIWDLEKRFQKFKKHNLYKPKKKFNGSSKECFCNFKEKNK